MGSHTIGGKVKSESCSVMSVSPMGCSPPGFTVYEILQARIPEWVAIHFSRGSSQARNQTGVSCTAGRLFTIWTTRKVHISVDQHQNQKIDNDTVFYRLNTLSSFHQCLHALICVCAFCCCSVAQSDFCDPMDWSKVGILVPYHLLELAQTHVHWIGEAIQPSCPVSFLSSPAFNLSQHQGLF